MNVFNHKTVSFDLTPYRMPSYQPISPGVWVLLFKIINKEKIIKIMNDDVNRYFLRVKRQKVSTYEFTNLEFKNGGKYTVLINKESENVLVGHDLTQILFLDYINLIR